MSNIRGVYRDRYDAPMRPAATVGEPITWKPTCFFDGLFPGAVKNLNGRVIYVNEAHRYYVAEADCFGRPLREAFKF